MDYFAACKQKKCTFLQTSASLRFTSSFYKEAVKKLEVRSLKEYLKEYKKSFFLNFVYAKVGFILSEVKMDAAT